jgi:hypothetical protein
MALTKCNVPSNVIGSLATRAEERGLTTQEFKDKFDEMPEGIKQYINEVLTEEIDAHIADYLAHKAEKATDANGVHGLKIEEGIWTPTLSGGNHTYLERSGAYYKIGKAVTIRFNILLQAKDGGMTGNALITGLPFAANGVFGVEKALLEGITMPSGFTTDYVGYLIGTYIELRCLSNGSWDNIKAENIGDNARIYASAVYFVG